MPRPPRNRRMISPPVMKGYKPFGIPFSKVGHITLLFEEYESVRLTDYQGLNQEQAALKMNISRPTFTRIYENARNKIAAAFVEGKAIIFDGGNVVFDNDWYKCDKCHQTFNLRPEDKKSCPSCFSDQIIYINENMPASKKILLQRGQTKYSKGNKVHCICIHCGYKQPHKRGIPCREEKCPNCNKPLVRDEADKTRSASDKTRGKDDL